MLNTSSVTQAWKIKYLDLAQHFSTWSKDPSSQIGAVAVGELGQILTQGYNGFPRGILDTPERLNHRETKYGLVVHAEMNCIYNAATLGINLSGAKLFIYGLPPCSACSLGIIQSGISEVHIRPNYAKLTPEWIEAFNKSADNFEEVGIYWSVEVPRLEGPEYLANYRFPCPSL